MSARAMRRISDAIALLAGLHPLPHRVGDAIVGMVAAELLERLVGVGIAAFFAQLRDSLELALEAGLRDRRALDGLDGVGGFGLEAWCHSRRGLRRGRSRTRRRGRERAGARGRGR